MNKGELLQLLKSSTSIQQNAFIILKEICTLLTTKNKNNEAQELLIRCLEYRESFGSYSKFLNSLLREAGLFPYVDVNQLDDRDLLAFETHRPIDSFTVGDIVFHRKQAQIYWDLLDEKNIVLSAPTSFGKSLISDALIASGKYQSIVIVVPTIALIDETRKRLTKFQQSFKIITHSSQLQEKNKGVIYVLTQERVIERKDLVDVDLLIIDEFYKLDPSKSEVDRSSILNHAFYKLLKISKQFYLLGPNINGIPDEFLQKYNANFIDTDYATVATNVIKVDTSAGTEDALINLASSINEPTIIYCQSPPSVRRVAELLLNLEINNSCSSLNDIVQWVGENFDESWVLTRALAKGIGIHHGGIPRSLAQYQVKLFNDSKLKFLICTSTLIEGVNTVAKNIIVFDNRIASSKFDYFTFKNIQGRSGRMFKHFIGNVFLFHEPPPEEQQTLDFPVITLSKAASDGLLMQLDVSDMNDRGKQLRKKYLDHEYLSFETIKANAHISPEVQINLAKHLTENAKDLESSLCWSGLPTSQQLYDMCDLLCEFELVPKKRNVIKSAKQLSHLTNLFRNANNVGIFIKRMANGSSDGDVTDKIDLALFYLRNWASHHLPKAIMALQRIQNDVFKSLNLELGVYSVFASKLEHLMLPPSFNAIDEYGLPLQIVNKIQHLLNSEDDLDKVLNNIKNIDLNSVNLSDFEKNWVNSVKAFF